MMDDQIRVKTDSRYSPIYVELKNFVVVDFHELFFVCACLGYKFKKSKPIEKKDDRFWSSTINPTEWACYYAILLEENNMEFFCIRDDKSVISKIEEYANAGMGILIQEFLGDYLINNVGEQQLDPSCSKELPKQFLHFVFDQIDTAIDSSNK